MSVIRRKAHSGQMGVYVRVAMELNVTLNFNFKGERSEYGGRTIISFKSTNLNCQQILSVQIIQIILTTYSFSLAGSLSKNSGVCGVCC